MESEEAMELAQRGFDVLHHALGEGQSGRLKQWLVVFGRFHLYSFRNVLLISLQMPAATFVAGCRKWPQLGRHVKQGEKGIAILAPIVYKRTSNDAVYDMGETNKEQRVLHFQGRACL